MADEEDFLFSTAKEAVNGPPTVAQGRVHKVNVYTKLQAVSLPCFPA